jgi:FKBP-type peptidyl-prolyl cis-trans isomerase FkpA
VLILALLLSQSVPAPAAPVPVPPAEAPLSSVTTPSGLRFEVLAAGTGRRPMPGDAVLATYVGRLADGTIFDSAAAPVGLSVSGAIPGFTEALLMMNAGGRYHFVIPARLAYGARGRPGIVPPGATLDFTLALIRVGRPAPH